MAHQDNIIIIKTEETITTSILDYFLNIALVTEIDTGDLVTDKTFDSTGVEIYASLSSVAEKFVTSSKIYKIARDIFNQKNNFGINQSNFKRLAIIKKEISDPDFASALNRVGYNNAYFVIVNPIEDQEINSVNDWIQNKRKMQFAQISMIEPTEETDENGEPIIDETTGLPVLEYDIATVLKNKKSSRTALYYHKYGEDESLAGAVASILASYPVGAKSASFKKPSGITVNKLSDTEEAKLSEKNVNYYVNYIGGAGDYGTRQLTSDNGVTSGGKEIEEVIAIDRIVLTLQANLMDALEQDIPYDDNGGTILYGKVVKALTQVKNDGLLAEDSVDEETGEVDKSFTVHIPTRATLKREYNEYFKQKMFIIQVVANLAGTAKKVMLTFAY